MSIYKTRQELIDKAKEFGLTLKPIVDEDGGCICYEVIKYINQSNVFVSKFNFDIKENNVWIKPCVWIGDKIHKNLNEILYSSDYQYIVFKINNEEKTNQLNKLSNRYANIFKLKDFLVSNDFYLDVFSEEDIEPYKDKE